MWLVVVIVMCFFAIFTVIGMYFKFIHYPLTGAKRVPDTEKDDAWYIPIVFMLVPFCVFMYALLDAQAAIIMAAVLSPIFGIPLWWRLIKWLFKP